jgi:hypothetical protein
MNFLPMVITFLLIFGTLSLSFMKGQGLDKTEVKAYKGGLRALRLAHNEIEEDWYAQRKKNHSIKRLKRASSQIEKEEDEADDLEIRPYFRITRIGSEHGAINLANLIENRTTNPLLRKKTLQYLHAMYGKASFIQFLKNGDWAERLLDQLITVQTTYFKKNNQFLPLADIDVGKEFQPYYTRLLRGTNSFNPLSLEGYLPLEKCLTFQKGEEPPINFHFANQKLLSVFFGQEVCQKIQQTEWPDGHPRKRRHSPSKYALEEDELKELLSDKQDWLLLNFFSYQYRKNKRYSRRAYDLETGISIQITEGTPQRDLELKRNQ